VLDREDCLAVNSRSTDPQQQITHDQNCLDDIGERSTFADWQTANGDDQQLRPLVCSCPSGTNAKGRYQQDLYEDLKREAGDRSGWLKRLS